MNVSVKFLKTHPDAILPQANNVETGTGDTGYDLFAVEDVFLRANEDVVVPVGLTLAFLTPGYWMRIEPRSGLGFKKGIQPHLGVIDNGYRGDLGVKLYSFTQTQGHQIKKGDKIAQLVLYPLIQSEMSFTDRVETSARGSSGFGSSDSKPSNTQQSSDDWFRSNTYQIDEGRVEHPWFDTIEQFNAYAAETKMPQDIHEALLKNKSWIKRN